jgi:hypothetical protein
MVLFLLFLNDLQSVTAMIAIAPNSIAWIAKPRGDEKFTDIGRKPAKNDA